MRTSLLALLLLVSAALGLRSEPATHDVPLATIDLATREGVALVKGTWRYSDAKIIEIDFTGPGSDGQPTGADLRRDAKSGRGRLR